MKISNLTPYEDFQQTCHVATTIDGLTVEADCRVWLAKFVDIHLTAPYKEIALTIRVEEEKGNFYDFEEAMTYVEKALHKLITQIGYVRQHPREYALAYSAFRKCESNHNDRIPPKAAKTEYQATLGALLNLPVDDPQSETYFIYPSLLRDIFSACIKKRNDISDYHPSV